MAGKGKKNAGIPSTGVVQWFDPNRGFGLVSVNNKWNDSAFVHISQIAGAKTLSTGQKVKFNLLPAGKMKGNNAKAKWAKVKAANVKVVGKAPKAKVVGGKGKGRGKGGKAGKAKKEVRPWVDPEAEPWPTTGTVMWYDQNRGFGLVKMDNEWKDVAYIHYTNIEGGKPLKSGQKVACNLVADGNAEGTQDERWQRVKAEDLKVVRGGKYAPYAKYAAPVRPKFVADFDEEDDEDFMPVKPSRGRAGRGQKKPKALKSFIFDMAMDFDYMAKKFQYLANKF